MLYGTDAVTLSGIAHGKQKICETFNFNMQGVINFTKKQIKTHHAQGIRSLKIFQNSSMESPSIKKF